MCPILTQAELEKKAEEILQRYYPEALNCPRQLSGEVLTRRIGLKVIYVNLGDDARMQDLIESIRTNGILTPAIVRSVGKDKYEMISGHRRMHAAKILGMERIPVIIREMSDDEAEKEEGWNDCNWHRASPKIFFRIIAVDKLFFIIPPIYEK